MLFLCLYRLSSLENTFPPLTCLFKIPTFRKNSGNTNIFKRKEDNRQAMWREKNKIVNYHVKIFHITQNQNENLKIYKIGFYNHFNMPKYSYVEWNSHSYILAFIFTISFFFFSNYVPVIIPYLPQINVLNVINVPILASLSCSII